MSSEFGVRSSEKSLHTPLCQRGKRGGILVSHLTLLLFASCFSLLNGCAAVQPARPPEVVPAPAPVTGNEIIKGITDYREKVYSLKGTAKVRVVRGGKDTSAQEVIVVKRPGKIRAETLGVFGNPVFILATDGSTVNMLTPAENRLITEEISFRRGPFPFDILGPEELVDILLGNTPMIKYGDSFLEYSDAEKTHVLTLRSLDGFRRQTIRLDAETMRIKNSEIADAEKGRMVSIDLDNYQDVSGITFPKEIAIDFFLSNDRIGISYEDIELNAEAEDELFVLSPPASKE
jgi:outer membrane lipoprotein-sorting protein